MGARRLGWGLAVLVAGAGAAKGQLPAVPGAPPPAAAPAVPGAAAPAGAAAAGAAAPPKNIWSFFMKTPEQKAQCKAHFCNSRIGQFVNNLLVPAGGLTGGLLGPVCPGPNVPNPEDLKKSAATPQGAAAKIKAEEAQAKAKIEAIEYLATVDCHYYPEAEAGLITGLRAEKNECVRLAAAKALASGCCCTPKVLKALMTTVSGTPKDPFPPEASELVKCYAYVALERCLAKCVEAEPEAPPEPPPAAKQAMYELLVPLGTQPDYTTHLLLAGYYTAGSVEAPEKLYTDARRVLGGGLKLSPQTLLRLSGPRNVRDAVIPNGLGLPRPAEVLARFDPRGVLTSRSQLVVEAAADPEPERPPREYVVTVTSGTLAPGQPVTVSMTTPAPAPTSRTGRGNLLDIFRDAVKR